MDGWMDGWMKGGRQGGKWKGGGEGGTSGGTEGERRTHIVRVQTHTQTHTHQSCGCNHDLASSRLSPFSVKVSSPFPTQTSHLSTLCPSYRHGRRCGLLQRRCQLSALRKRTSFSKIVLLHFRSALRGLWSPESRALHPTAV